MSSVSVARYSEVPDKSLSCGVPYTDSYHTMSIHVNMFECEK